jgi:hypothetical protein
MIWLSWRQLRTSAAVTFGALALVAVVVLVTGLQLHRAYTASGLVGCTGDACRAIADAFRARDPFLQTVLGNVLLLLLPALTGVFWAAPLVSRELETGTYRLAWTQSVTRTRWMTAKLVVVGVASLLATAALTALVTWWYTPIDLVNANGFSPAVFGARDLVPIGYATFAFGLGVAAGVLTRRTVLRVLDQATPRGAAPRHPCPRGRRPADVRLGPGQQRREMADLRDRHRSDRGRHEHHPDGSEHLCDETMPERLPRDDGLPAG